MEVGVSEEKEPKREAKEWISCMVASGPAWRIEAVGGS